MMYKKFCRQQCQNSDFFLKGCGSALEVIGVGSLPGQKHIPDRENDIHKSKVVRKSGLFDRDELLIV